MNEELTNGLDYHNAVKAMHKGCVVEYIGTLNGNVPSTKRPKFCMLRGVILEYINGVPVPKSYGTMLYDSDFRYKLTNETVDTKKWF